MSDLWPLFREAALANDQVRMKHITALGAVNIPDAKQFLFELLAQPDCVNAVRLLLKTAEISLTADEHMAIVTRACETCDAKVVKQLCDIFPVDHAAALSKTICGTFKDVKSASFLFNSWLHRNDDPKERRKRKKVDAL